MKLCVSHVYWMLLFTSVVSSTLLFIIVASESIQNSKFIGPDRNQVYTQEENVSSIDDFQDQFEPDSESQSNIKIPTPLTPKIRQQNFQDYQPPLTANFHIASKNKEPKIPKAIEILKESLTQQPNLSQGISDGGQTVVLTLVDTAASLQNLANSRGDFSTKSPGSEGNASTGTDTSNDGDEHEADDLLHISKLLENNGSASYEMDFYSKDEEIADPAVVVVRAEQKSAASIRNELGAERVESGSGEILEHDEMEEDQQQDLSSQHLPKSPTPAPDLNDSAARAQLMGSADDSAAVILDSLVTAGPSDPHEEIPSFNEWTQKRLEEAEKKKTHPNASVQTPSGSPGRNVGSMRMRSKNYASPDCGAKIVAANPEARSARSVLVSTRDEYMLNTCTSRVWFVVELCEAIQAKKIELANFELFSSSPKDISVYVSDRFPTREWSNVGQFTARDERDVQSFSLQPHLFGKFIKVELHSHYGSEHFCPISLFRAYGTSEFEVLETETETDSQANSQRREISAGGNLAAGSDLENEDDDDEENLFEDEEESTSEPPGHLFGSARDAVISIVKKAAEVLIKSHDLKSTNNITKIQESIRGDVLEDATLDDCTTPIYSVACRDCDDDRFARVFQLISCRGHYLESLLCTSFVQKTLAHSHLCSSSFGFGELVDSYACTDGEKALEPRKSDLSNYYMQAQFLSSIFTPDYIIALCNVLAAREQRLFANASHQQQHLADRTPNKTRVEQTNQVPLPTKDERIVTIQDTEIPTPDVDKTKAEPSVIKSKAEVVVDSVTLGESIAIQMKPTKRTGINDEAKVLSSTVPHLEASKGHQLEDNNAHQIESSSTTETPVPVNTKRTPPVTQKTASGSTPHEHVHVAEHTQEKETSQMGATKVQSSDSSQKVNEKSGGAETDEAETKFEEEVEGKAKPEPVEQDPKAATQDQLNFDGFDFKYLDENLQGNGAVKSDPSATQQTDKPGTPQQKESVFLRLSNRIKALERNMSLSSQYLEELSRRYKKQVEEMQRSLERAMTAMNEESRKGEERESKRVEEVGALHNQIDILTKALNELLYERNSWAISFSSLVQHALFVLVDVVLVILILSYCRRVDDDMDYYDEEVDVRSIAVKPKRGKSYEIVKQNCSQLTKKPKKRRPSEIASQVSGTYDQLMIENSIAANQSKRDRRKKRKKEALVLRTFSVNENNKRSDNFLDVNSRETILPSRSASASDALYSSNQNNDTGNGFANLGSQRQSRPESAPENSLAFYDDQQSQYDKKVQILAMNVNSDELNKSSKDASNLDKLNESISLEDDIFEPAESTASVSYIKPKKLSSPSFMKTALGSRSKRISFSGGSIRKQSLSLDESMMKPIEKKYDVKVDSFPEIDITNGAGDDMNNGRPTNGHVEDSDESRSSCATPSSSWNKKEKKSNGLKKMVRKFF